MRWATLIAALIGIGSGLGACSRSPGPPAAAASPDASRPDAAAAIPPSRAPSEVQFATLALRARALYDTQQAIELPKGFPDALLAAMPAGQSTRPVRFEVAVDMAQARFRPGARRVALTWLTPARWSDTRAAMAAGLVAAGWLNPGAELTPPLVRPNGEQLIWQATREPGKPDQLEWTLVPTAIPAALRDAIDGRIPKAFVDDALRAQVVGVEYGRYHASGPRADTTDVERIALAFALGDASAARAFIASIDARAQSAGYARSRDVWRHPDGRTVTTRTPGPDGGL